jgi:predicted RNA binding protein YcfA (HicA-like mRNA interferase family)
MLNQGLATTSLYFGNKRGPLPYTQVVTTLNAAGFTYDRSKGDHDIFKHPILPGIASVPAHREIPLGTLQGIKRQAGIDPWTGKLIDRQG